MDGADQRVRRTESQLLRPLADVLSAALIAVDFDGTLAPIVPAPDAARPAPGAVQTLAQLASLGARVAIITGREAQVAIRLGGLDQIPRVLVDGVYGAQQHRDGRLIAMPTPPAMRAARAQLDAIIESTPGVEGVWVEDKDISVVVHTRLARDPGGSFDRLAGPLSALAAAHGLTLHAGKQVLELRVPGLDKGTALASLLAERQPAGLLWAGDDLGDLPAFELLRGWRGRTGRPAVGIAVGPPASPSTLTGQSDPLPPELVRLADLIVSGPDGLVAALRQLLQLRTAAS